jgi:PAS domain S-box-containing protein
VFDEAGRFVGYRGVGRDITARKRAEAERREHVWFLESMDRINRAIQGTDDLERMMSDALLATVEIFACDRAWLVYPCDPAAPSWHAVMEHTRPEYPGAFAARTQFPIDADVATLFAAALAAPGAIVLGPGGVELPPQVAQQFAIQSAIAIAVDAKADKPYLFGLHQCSRPRDWTEPERRLLQEIGRRLGDGLSTLSMLRHLRDSERKLEAAHEIAHLGWWERDVTTNQVVVSREVQRIFGVGVERADQFEQLIHPEDRAAKDAAVVAAVRGGPRYDVEYRVVRPDGALRVVHSQGDIIRDESGRAVRQFGVLQDVTELRRAEHELIASEQRYRALFDNANDAFFVLDDELNVVDVNPQACRSLG